MSRLNSTTSSVNRQRKLLETMSPISVVLTLIHCHCFLMVFCRRFYTATTKRNDATDMKNPSHAEIVEILPTIFGVCASSDCVRLFCMYRTKKSIFARHEPILRPQRWSWHERLKEYECCNDSQTQTQPEEQSIAHGPDVRPVFRIRLHVLDFTTPPASRLGHCSLHGRRAVYDQPDPGRRRRRPRPVHLPAVDAVVGPGIAQGRQTVGCPVPAGHRLTAVVVVVIVQHFVIGRRWSSRWRRRRWRCRGLEATRGVQASGTVAQ